MLVLLFYSHRREWSLTCFSMTFACRTSMRLGFVQPDMRRASTPSNQLYSLRCPTPWPPVCPRCGWRTRTRWAWCHVPPLSAPSTWTHRTRSLPVSFGSLRGIRFHRVLVALTHITNKRCLHVNCARCASDPSFTRRVYSAQSIIDAAER